MFIASSGLVSGEVPGLQSVASASGTPAARSAIDRRHQGVAGEVEGAGQQHRDGAGGGHGGHAGGVEVFDVVCRQCAEARGQFGAVLVAQLFGVDLDRQPVLRAAANSCAACACESRYSQNTSTASARPCAATAGIMRSQDFVDMRLRLRARRHRMGAQEGGHHLDRAQLAQRAGYAQLPALVFQGEAVAGFDFDRGHALGQHGVQARQRGGQQGALIGGAGRAHGGDDAAARTGDVGVAGALQALLELVGAVAGIDQVGMAVDQAGVIQRPPQSMRSAASRTGADDAAPA